MMNISLESFCQQRSCQPSHSLMLFGAPTLAVLVHGAVTLLRPSQSDLTRDIAL